MSRYLIKENNRLFIKSTQSQIAVDYVVSYYRLGRMVKRVDLDNTATNVSIKGQRKETESGEIEDDYKYLTYKNIYCRFKILNFSLIQFFTTLVS